MEKRILTDELSAVYQEICVTGRKVKEYHHSQKPKSKTFRYWPFVRWIGEEYKQFRDNREVLYDLLFKYWLETEQYNTIKFIGLYYDSLYCNSSVKKEDVLKKYHQNADNNYFTSYLFDRWIEEKNIILNTNTYAKDLNKIISICIMYLKDHDK